MTISTETAIAYQRFGYGVNPNQTLVESNHKTWLINQLKPIFPDSSIWSLAKAYEYQAQYRKMRMEERKGNQSEAQMQQSDKFKKKFYQQSKLASYYSAQFAIETENGLQARLLDFFSNHFSVTASGNVMRALAPLLEIEAIAPNLTGKFSDLLLAVESHPAMLVYLNNEQSVGPDSQLAKKRKNKGLNENLAREILELHTLGVDGGYNQQDVIELAKAITGWSVANPIREDTIGFIYRQRTHQPGKRKVLGKTYSQKGMEQGKAILQDLAVHPATAKFVCTKLVRHFISDQPNQQIVQTMQAAWKKTDGDIKAVITAMIEHPESWREDRQKFKTPREFLISSYRLSDIQYKGKQQRAFMNSLEMMGQKPFSAGSPAGFKDERNAWDGPDALLNRIDWANAYAKQVKKDPLELAKAAFGESLSANTYTFLKRAESRQQALAMLLMSPEFQFS
ncbi:hypothetical protein DS2_11843 [Catenovulum agarivorans DS-2]|uniref:DUF1800 domain-containing protein n=1 Tax=Catenovulum agarivorans DS-2 TaxID=1328313 RepID=W7QA35_9ALTE|nr:DUF1800 domain-containing protein [Catenovulum agarivorans]EWH09659.1 hypothetical protein DS2_11843 [Catenovulum agarivorans DS-2]